jgi:hypothetical protein
MDTAKHKVPAFASDDEQTGIFRRLEYPAASRSNQPAASPSNQAERSQPRETERTRSGPERSQAHASAESRAEDSTRRRENERRLRHEDARHERAPEPPSSGRNLEVGPLGTSGLGGVTYDAKGDPVWEWRVDVPRRREDDPTLDLLKCLDLNDLRLEDETKEADQGVNPYDTARIRLRK